MVSYSISSPTFSAKLNGKVFVAFVMRRTGIWSLPFLHRRTACESQRIFLAGLARFRQ